MVLKYIHTPIVKDKNLLIASRTGNKNINLISLKTCFNISSVIYRLTYDINTVIENSVKKNQNLQFFI